MVGFIPITLVNTPDNKDEDYEEMPTIVNVEQIKCINFCYPEYAEILFIGIAASNEKGASADKFAEAFIWFKCDKEKRASIILTLTELGLFHKLIKPKKDESTK